MERLKPDERKQQIIFAAIEMAMLNSGYKSITRDGVAVLAKCSMGLINHYFGTVEELREEVIKRAIALELPSLIAEAILDRSSLVEEINDDLRAKAATYILDVTTMKG